MELDSGLCIYTAEKHGVKTEKTKIMKKPSKIKKLIYIRMYLLYILNIILVYDAKGSNQKSCHSSCRHRASTTSASSIVLQFLEAAAPANTPRARVLGAVPGRRLSKKRFVRCFIESNAFRHLNQN